MTPVQREDLVLKRYEELYSLAKAGYDAQMQRHEGAEAKVVRYVSLLVILVGATTIEVREFAIVLQNPTGIAQWVFVVSYFLFALSSILAFCYFLRALRVRRYPALAMDETLVSHFQENRYIDAIFSLAKAIFSATESARQKIENKFRVVAIGFWLLAASVAFAGITTGSYLCIRSTEVRMTQKDTQQEGSGQQTDKQPSGPADHTQEKPSKLSESEPDPTVKAPKLVEETRGP